jgi:hypothetical protein
MGAHSLGGNLDRAPLCRERNDSVPHRNIEIEAERGIDILTDRAIPIVLIANELITNADFGEREPGADTDAGAR